MKVKVIIKDRFTLVLEEDAKKGDEIDLNDLRSVDTDLINDLIEQHKDKKYQQLLEQEKQKFVLEKQGIIKDLNLAHQEEINKLKSSINELNLKLSNKEKELNDDFKVQIANFKNDAKTSEAKIETKYNKELNDLKIEKQQLINNHLIEKQKLENIYKDKINELENKINNFNLEKELALKAKEEQVSQIFNEKLNNLREENTKLTLEKSHRNVKQTGEDLEAWCDNEVKLAMQNGFSNCVWTKDNDVVRNDDEAKGSKADYIMKIYASDKFIDNEFLTSICLEMKDENPLSTNKKKNEDYYKQLDKNRNKKNCKYALLVSNLELDKPNDNPIYKVREYNDMYVVRPQYLLVFLNLLVSLNVKFKDLLLKDKKENEMFIKSEELKKTFEDLKNTYLDKPLEALNKNVDEIYKQSDAIISAAEKIKDANNKIVEKYIKEINKKLEKFNVRKISKMLDEQKMEE